MGYDVHQLVEGRDLFLGGVKIDHAMGLLGHSDADVLIHAICDALLGAAELLQGGELADGFLRGLRSGGTAARRRYGGRSHRGCDR